MDALATKWYADAATAGLSTTAWSAGEWWGCGYKLSGYTCSTCATMDGNLSVPKPQASVIEAQSSVDRRGINMSGGDCGQDRALGTTAVRAAFHRLVCVSLWRTVKGRARTPRRSRKTEPVRRAMVTCCLQRSRGGTALRRGILRNDDALDRYLAERAWLFELALNPMMVGSANGHLRVVNGAFQRLVNRQLDQLIGRPFIELVHTDDAEDVTEQFSRLGRGEPLSDYPVRMCRGDVDYRWVEWTVTPSPAEEAFYAVGRDITERRRVEEQLSAQADELARSNADLEQFASVVSHDLAQPLRVICSYAELLGAYVEQLGPDYLQLVERIQVGGRQMQELTRDLLAYCRVGNAQVHLETVDCNDVVAVVLANLGPALRDGEVLVAPLPAVRADPTQVRQVFLNLLLNAVTYVRPAVRPRVMVEGQRDGGVCRFSVTDNGIGIPGEERKRIFEMFERIDPRADEPGTGIGLAICARVIDRHGGRIWVEDGPGGVGSRFYFTLRSA